MTQMNEDNIMFIVRVYVGRNSWYDLELGSSIRMAILYLKEIRYDLRHGRMYPSTYKCLKYFNIEHEFNLETPLTIDLGCVYKEGERIVSEAWIPILSFKRDDVLLERGFELLRSVVLFDKKNVFDKILYKK